jgi:hypothetical protein
MVEMAASMLVIAPREVKSPGEQVLAIRGRDRINRKPDRQGEVRIQGPATSSSRGAHLNEV